MNVLLDLLGALMIATLLLLMMITFQLQLRETADRTIFAALMMDHVQASCRELNNILALAGVGYRKEDVVITTAQPTQLIYNTYWDYQGNVKTSVSNTIDLSLDSLETAVGKRLLIEQSSNPVYSLDAIFYLEDLRFVYYNTAGASLGASVTGDTRKDIYSVDVNMTFKRKAPVVNTTDIRTRIQLRCHLMNRYLHFTLDD